MKISNYIILSFFIFLFGGIFILFVTSKIDPRSNRNLELVTEEKPLGNFSVVVAETGANIRIKSGETTKMELYYLKGDTCTFPTYTVRNDTLFVGTNPPKNKYWATNIICRQINRIEGKEKCQINIEQFHCDSLFVQLNKADFRYYSEKSSTAFSLKLIANDSYINLQKANIDKLNLDLSHTQMDSWNNHVKNLSGKLNEKSRLYLDRIQKINIEADSTSTYRLEK